MQSVMRHQVPGREKGHCHSQAVGQWMRWDETAWWKTWAVVLTSCGMRWDENTSQNKGQCHITHFLLVGMEWDVVTMKEKVCHSLAIGHGRCDDSAWQETGWFLLTPYLTWGDSWLGPGRRKGSTTHILLIMRVMKWHGRNGSVTHKLLVMGGDAMRLHDRTNSSVTCILLVIGSDAGWDCMI